MSAMSDVSSLFVIGDQHAAFWQGIPSHQFLGEFKLEDMAPVLPPDYTGWVLLHFGGIDYVAEALAKQQGESLSEDDAIAAVVEHYAGVFLWLKGIYPKIAVWGPSAAVHVASDSSGTSDEIERNRLAVCATKMLRERLAPYEIPLLSLLDSMIAPNGATLREYIQADGALAPVVLPTALQAVNDVLGLQLDLPAAIFALREQRVKEYLSVERIVKNDWPQVQFILPTEPRFVSVVCIPRDILSAVNTLTIGTSCNDEDFSYVSYTIDTVDNSDKYTSMLSVMTYAKTLLVSALMGQVNERDIDIFAMLP